MPDGEANGRRGAGQLSDRVVDVVRAADGWCSVRDVHEQLSREGEIAYTTILTVLQRLARQGVLDHHREGRAGRYRIAAAVDPQGARSLVDHALTRFGVVAITQFVERAREDPVLFDELRRQMAVGPGGP